MDSDQSTATALQAVSAAVNAQSYEQQLNQAVYYQQQQVQAQQAAQAQAQAAQMSQAQAAAQQAQAQAQSALLHDEHGRQYTQIVHPNGSVSHIMHSPLLGFQPVTPPQAEFTTRAELIDYIHKYAKTHGFGIVISHSNEKAIYFTCELGGSYRNKRNITDEKRKRKLNTRKCNCPFAMVANSKRDETGSGAPNRWTLRVSNNEHNHDKLNLNEDYPTLRRRNPEVNALIRELYIQGEKPSTIESKLKTKFPDILINREDIYNETRKMKREERNKRDGDSHTQRISENSPAISNNGGNLVMNNSMNQVIVDPLMQTAQQSLNQIHHANHQPGNNSNTTSNATYDTESLPSILQAQLNQMYDHTTAAQTNRSHENHQQLSQLSDLAVDGYVQQHHMNINGQQGKINNDVDIESNIDTSLGMK
ncbi:hypothetical protein WICPIJ_007231 [Wickerhamomyces pijperi]|uniref:FAR1 domain-containing protein n=1 Tax=Wickerhamomyces pijperi TaxID=599730 RepID=A0A9P8Q286_WICPI|nr:hypothetical protein WICPIJ_007231 [Wickerhamomyces pijperi]